MAKKSVKQGRKKVGARRKAAPKSKRPGRPKAARKATPAKSRSAAGARKKAAPARKARSGAKTAAKKAARPPSRSSKAPKKSPAGRAASRKARRAEPSSDLRRRAGFELESPEVTRGLGPEAGGQSGDTEGLSRSELADSESVEELLEEGQAFEAGIVSGVENAPDADEGEVRTRQFPEDDVPQEYLDED